MRTKAAVLWEVGGPWKVQEIDLDPPGDRELLVKLQASGLCHSDDHIVTGDTPCPYPMVGGHEGAGVVLEVGDRVTRTQVGDHVILAPVPQCGQCRWCSIGRPNLCDMGAFALMGYGPDGTYRRHDGDTDVGAYCQLGSFAKHTVVSETQVVPIRKDVPFEVAALVGCGVTTGLGAAQRVGQTQPGDVVVVVGIGGVGINAVQGAALAGAGTIVAVDPVARKRDWALEFGAHHAVASMDEAQVLVGTSVTSFVAMVVQRLIGPGSKLSATRLSRQTTLADELELGEVTEAELLAAMDWLLERQPRIEAALARRHLAGRGVHAL